jgi:glycosyltransferase involved in cell wall biosynthesis
MMRVVRILIVSRGRSGGAGIAAWRWHKALAESGFDSIFIDQQVIEDEKISQLQLKYRLTKFINRLLLHLTRITGHTPFGPFSFDYLGTPADAKIFELATTSQDIINLHWINSGFLSISRMIKMSTRSPVIWTAHDAWLLNGIAHYEIPGLDIGIRRLSIFKLLDEIAFKRKRRLLLTAKGVISPSQWLKSGFIASGIPEQNIRVIPNPVPFQFFQPLENRNSKDFKIANSLPSTSLLVGFISAGNLRDPRKGFDILEDALMRLSEVLRSEIVLVIAGRKFNRSEIKSGIKTIDFGEVVGDENLNKFYNLCDLLIVPSRMDNLPQTATEAQSSGCPVLISDVGGCSETISDGTSGWIFDGGAEDLNLRLEDLIKNRSKLASARHEAALFARESWDRARLVDSYTKFREEILSRNDSGKTS